MVALTLRRLVLRLCAYVPVPSRPTWWLSVTSLAGGAGWRGRVCLGPMLGAQPEYDSNGYGLMRLAGHTPKHWPVSSRPCDRQMSRPALHRAPWEAGFLTHNFGTRNFCTHNSFIRNFLTHNSLTLIHNYFTTSSHPTLAHTQLFHPHTSYLSNAHTLDKNGSLYDPAGTGILKRAKPA